MKKRIISLALILAMLATAMLSLSSCALLNGDSLLDMLTGGGNSDGKTPEGDTVINVEGGDSYNVSIYPEGEDNLLTASHALHGKRHRRL